VTVSCDRPLHDVDQHGPIDPNDDLGSVRSFLRHLGIPRRTHPRLWSLATGRGLVGQALPEPRRHHGDREDVDQFTGGVDQPLAADGAEPEPQMNPSKQRRVDSRIGQKGQGDRPGDLHVAALRPVDQR